MSQLWLLALVVWLTSASAMDKNKRAIGLDQDETVADRWTASPFGCECYFDASRHDCACCIAGACQCPGDNKNKCVQCGYGSLCDQDQPVIEGVISDGWTGPNECACPEDPFDRSCACCTNGGCLCPHNHDKCTQCGNKCGCSDGCDDGLCGAVPSGSPISLDSDEGLPRDGLGMLNERDPLPGSVPLGVESGLIRDSQMTASSTVDSILGPHRGRLGLYPSYYGLGAWSALISDNHQYLQIDLLYLTLVTGVATQGRSGTINAEYVTSYYIYYSEDGMNWLAFGDAEPLLMKGNSNPDDVVRHNLESGFHARYIRIAPQSYFGRVSLRVEVYGIPPEIPDEEIYGLANLALVKPAQLSSTLHTQFHARIAVDGVEDDGAAISKQQAQPWWYVDLLDHHHVFYITIVNVAAGVFNGLNSLENIVIRVGDDPDIHNNPVCGEFEDMISLGEMVQVECLDHNGIPMSGEYVSVELKAEYPVHLALAEVLVFGVPIPLPGFSGLPDGSHYLGLESGLIDNSQMTSSSHDPAYPAFHGRLNLFQNAWMPSRDDPVPFIQIDLLHLHMLTAIVTQGVAIPKEYWVTQYQLQLSLDGHDFVPYMDANENVMDFEGNHDGHDIMPHVFNSPFEARVVRVIPKTWVRRPAMRIELIGYKINNEPIVPEPNGGGTGTGTCEPIDYELCSALLPYDYGHLPNLLGVQGGSQFESAILEHILHVIVSDCLEPEFLTLFICGLMYPGCDGSADVMLPCRQFCELVSSECAEELGSVVDHSFCENMPDVNSDGECLMEDDIHMSPENKLLMDSWLQRMLGDEPPAVTGPQGVSTTMSTTSRLSTAMPSNNVSQTPALPLDTTRVMEAKSPTTVRINSPRDRDPREVEGGTPSELGGDSLTTDQGSYRPGYQFPGFDGPGYVAGDEDLGHQWLVLDFGAQVAIMRIVLGGVRGPDFEAFVKKFRLEYSDDGEAWFIYGDPSNGQLIELEGLSYVDEVKEIELQFILIARFLKIVPIEVENLFALKIRIYGYLYQDYAEYMHQMETLYYLIVEDPVSWHDAKYYCEYWGGFLATIPHAIVQHHLRREIQLYNLVGNWWFSPTDADNEGVWINSHDGKDLIFSDWLNGQLPENDVNKNCAQLLESEGYEWNHDLCDNSHNYICQFINEPDYSNLQYPDRDEQANAKADTQQIKAIDLFYIAEPANRFTWEDANNYCIGTGGSLLRIEQPEVQDTYAHLMSQYGIEGRFWLDPTNTVSHPNTHGWVYTNGQPIIYNVGLKDDSASVAKCAAMNSVAGFSWTAEKCADRTEGFFCQYYGERTPFSMDADSSLDVEEIYYEIVRVVNGFDWYRAQSYCQEEGGHLVRIEEQEIQEFLASKLNEHGFTGDYYIDAIMNDLGQVIYTNNEYVIYNDFHSSYPQGGCVYLAGGAMWRWEDGDCKMGRNFICQFYGNIHHNEPESGVDETTETETVYIQLLYNYGFSWYESETACRQNGGHLVRIRDHHFQEQLIEFIYSQGNMQGNYWIDVNDIDNEGTYLQTDGNKSPVQFWAQISGEEQPDDVFHSQNCVFLRENDGYMWHDGPCSQGMNFICQYSSEPAQFPDQMSPLHHVREDIMYTFILDSLNHNDARMQCADKYNGQLAMILSGYVEQQLVQFIEQQNMWGEYIFDATRVNGRWQYSDGSALPYMNWQNDDLPDGDTPMCAKLHYETVNDYYWLPEDCTAMANYVCEYDQGAADGGDNSAHEEIEVLYANLDFKISHEEATYICASYSAELGSINSEKILKIISDAFHDFTGNLWIGAHRDYDGTWKWVDGTLVTWLTFMNPADPGDCAVLSATDGFQGKIVDCVRYTTSGIICTAQPTLK